MKLSQPAALIVGHPGHELRLFRWLEVAHPLVFVLTDGSGSGSSRTASTHALLEATGSAAGPVVGAFTDSEIYDLMMRGDVTPVAELTQTIATSLAAHGVRSVVADAFEFYNPTHDLCAVVASLAAARAGVSTSKTIDRYDYPVTTAPTGEGIVLDLYPAELDRKLTAAYAFENLTHDVTLLLANIGTEALAREELRPVYRQIELPSLRQKPFYETHGEERVASGRYRTVLRYEQHFVPFVRALAAALGLESMVVQSVQSAAS